MEFGTIVYLKKGNDTDVKRSAYGVYYTPTSDGRHVIQMMPAVCIEGKLMPLFGPHTDLEFLSTNLIKPQPVMCLDRSEFGRYNAKQGRTVRAQRLASQLVLESQVGPANDKKQTHAPGCPLAHAEKSNGAGPTLNPEVREVLSKQPKLPDHVPDYKPAENSDGPGVVLDPELREAVAKFLAEKSACAPGCGSRYSSHADVFEQVHVAECPRNPAA